MSLGQLSRVMLSNLYTMGCAARKDIRQRAPSQRQYPVTEVRLLRARLILEEALETVKALGIITEPRKLKKDEKAPEGSVMLSPSVYLEFATDDALLEGIESIERENNVIDGCCDTIYVAIGTLVTIGVPDVAHLEEVCLRNEAKFPNGEAITDARGKFQKPEGWVGPNHAMTYTDYIDLGTVQDRMVERGSYDLSESNGPANEGERQATAEAVLAAASAQLAVLGAGLKLKPTRRNKANVGGFISLDDLAVSTSDAADRHKTHTPRSPEASE